MKKGTGDTPYGFICYGLVEHANYTLQMEYIISMHTEKTSSR
jgi:hypothetical protein